MEQLQEFAKKLTQRGFQTQVCKDAQEAREAALSLVEEGASAGFGGSMTISQLGIYETLQEKGHAVYWHWKAEPQQRSAVMENARTADIYFSSANAILEDGRIVNIDGGGNRVSSLFYGPKRVVIVAGINKICGDLQDGIARIKREACPPNARRLGLKTPCAVTGTCADCRSPQRICNVTTVMEQPAMVKDVHVILVNEKLGY